MWGPSAAHFRRHGSGPLDFLQVAYSRQVFKPAPGVARGDVQGDIARLAGVTPVYRSIAESLAGVVSWHFTALDNGLLSAYPGHGGIPAALDPREEPWFRPASSAMEWTRPYMDPATGRMVVTATLPVKGTGGVSGSTALVLPISNILDQSFLGRNITPRTQPFVGFIDTKGGEREIRIVASREYADGSLLDGREWTGESRLTSSDRAGLDAMMDDMEMGKGHIRKMPFDGEESIWVYGDANPVTLILITPMDEVVRSALGVRDRINLLVDRMITFTGVLMLGLLMLVVFLAFSFSKKVTRHLSALAKGATRLGEGDFDARVDIGATDEFGDLGRVFNSLVPRLREHSRLRRSMDLAREVQQRLLPSANPKVDGADIAGTGIYCDETGGDYYDFIDFAGKGKIGVIVGDVSGHDPAICYDPERDSFCELGGKGVPLGVFEESAYEECRKEIFPGEIIVIGTDGIWESRNREGAMFGKESLRRIIREGAAGSAEEIVQAAVSELTEFVTPMGFQDDVTLVVIKIDDFF